MFFQHSHIVRRRLQKSKGGITIKLKAVFIKCFKMIVGLALVLKEKIVIEYYKLKIIF